MGSEAVESPVAIHCMVVLEPAVEALCGGLWVEVVSENNEGEEVVLATAVEEVAAVFDGVL